MKPAFREYLKRVKKARRPLYLIKISEQAAQEILDQFDCTEWDNGIPIVPQNPHPAVRTAIKVITESIVLRKMMTRKNQDESIQAAMFALGWLYTQMSVELFEPAIQIARDMRVALWRGSWVKMTEQQERILKIVGSKNEIPAREVLKQLVNLKKEDLKAGSGALKVAIHALNLRLREARPPSPWHFYKKGNQIRIQRKS